MKQSMRQSLLKIVFVLGTIFAFSLVAAHAAPVKESAKTAKKTTSKKKSKKSAHASSVGEALRRKKYLVLENRTVESLNSGNFDSTLLEDGNAKNSKRLYSLPSDFKYRVADEGKEMRYRQ